MTDLFTGIAVATGVIVILLAVPLQMTWEISHCHSTHVNMNIHWLFGLIRHQIDIPATTQHQSIPAPKRESQAQTGNSGSTRNLRKLMRHAAFRRHACHYARKLLRATHPQDLDLDFRVGLGDPSDTGRLWSVLGPASAIMAGLRCARVRINPDFSDRVLDVRGRGVFLLVPLEIIVLAVGFFLSPASFHAWRVISGKVK